MTTGATPPVEPLALTGHELEALLGFGSSSATLTSRRVLEYAADGDIKLQLIGVATLVARGLADFEGGNVTPVGRAHYVAVALTTATGWMRAVVAADDLLAVDVVVTSPVAAPRVEALGAWAALVHGLSDRLPPRRGPRGGPMAGSAGAPTRWRRR